MSVISDIAVILLYKLLALNMTDKSPYYTTQILNGLGCLPCNFFALQNQCVNQIPSKSMQKVCGRIEMSHTYICIHRDGLEQDDTCNAMQ